MSPCNSCEAPASTTNVTNTAVTAEQFSMEAFTLGVGLTVTLANLPASGGFFLVFDNGVCLVYGTSYTVDFLTGVVTIIGGVAGHTINVIYIIA